MTGKAEKEGLRRVKQERSDNTQLREWVHSGQEEGEEKKWGQNFAKNLILLT